MTDHLIPRTPRVPVGPTGGTDPTLAYASPLVSPGDRNRAVIAGFLGWTLDAFDFFLVVFCITAISKEFGVSKASVVFANTLTLAARPLGAIVFGLMADRYGRRAPLMINLVFYSIIEVLSGLAPNFGTFLLLRFLFGVGMGGEWGVGASLTMEKVSPKFRGLLSGVLQEGYAIGGLLASLAYGKLFPYFRDNYPWTHGWRALFFIGGVPALLSLFVRYGIKESEVWEKTKSETWDQLFNAIGRNWKLLLFIVVLMAAFNSSSHGTQDLYPTFLQSDVKLPPNLVGRIGQIAFLGAFCGGLAFGFVSDRIGRRAAITIALIGAVCCIPLWANTHGGDLYLVGLGGFLIQFMVQGAWGIIPAHLSELTPDNVRGFLPGFGYQCGALIAGLVPWLQESLAEKGSRPHVMAVVSAAVFIAAIVIVLFGGERRGVVFGQKETAAAGGFPVG